jgi:osmotically inducible lipoprotein OsmB
VIKKFTPLEISIVQKKYYTVSIHCHQRQSFRRDLIMKKTYCALASAFLGVMLLSGCTNSDIGMTTGAVAGGVIGSQLGGPAATIGGTIAGGWIGREVGKNW